MAPPKVVATFGTQRSSAIDAHTKISEGRRTPSSRFCSHGSLFIDFVAVPSMMS